MSANKQREIVVAADTAALAAAAAQRLVSRVARDGRTAVCLTGGSTPEGFYRLLAEAPWRGKVPWDRVHWFMGDDRFVPQSDPLSNMGMARRLFLAAAGAPRGNIHPIPTDANYPEGAANIYEDELKSFYGADRLDPTRPLFDLVLMGLGPARHPDFPGARLDPRNAVPGRWRRQARRAAARVCGGRFAGRPRLFRRRTGLAARSRRGAGGGIMKAPSDIPSVIVVMGVSGCGKSTIAAMLAHRLRWIYEDGDWFHPKANVEKMHHGEPLTDEDRWPWLRAIAAWIDAPRQAGNHGVVACSALKRDYRDILIGPRRDVRIVYLK